MGYVPSADDLAVPGVDRKGLPVVCDDCGAPISRWAFYEYGQCLDCNRWAYPGSYNDEVAFTAAEKKRLRHEAWLADPMMQGGNRSENIDDLWASVGLANPVAR